MILRVSSFLFFLFFLQTVSAQDNLPVATIASELKENANAVIRLDKADITISSHKSMNIKKHRVVTILNEYGLHYLQAGEMFNNSTNIKSIEAVIYDSFGKEIKKIKKKDFKESSVSEGSIITNNKVLVLVYTPITYPFTLVYHSEIQTSNTAFIPSWSPVEGVYASVEKSEVNIHCDKELGLRYKGYNFNASIAKQELEDGVSFTALNIPAVKKEDYLPSLHKIAPMVMFGLEKFHLEGVDGNASSWESFGKWMYVHLLTGTDELPAQTVAAINNKVSGETDPLKKAKIVYEYVQDKTRYISIQLGIGGWKPMLARDVDRLGYGDCKALTNYTRALLKAVGVDSNYTVVYGDRNRKDIKEDFVSMQGNHVILAIPNSGTYTWLECTSQILPFGFQGDFTDDRLALIIKPGGAEVVKTHIYEVDESSQISKGSYVINENGAISGSIAIESGGIQYDNKYHLEGSSKEDLNKMYKEVFGHINNLTLKKTSLKNDKTGLKFIEEIIMEAQGYANKSGDRLIFAVNAFNQSSNIPQRYRDRKGPFEISRGFYDADEIVIDLPAGFTIEAKPDNIILTDKFGEYKAEYELLENNRIIYKRMFRLEGGIYESKEYENYRLFREKIARNDNAKVVLVKT